MDYYASIISTVALVISGANYLRDRPWVKISSSYHDGSEYDPAPGIHVVVVNKGRRPVILRMIGGSDDSEHWSGTVLDHAKGGIRLGEHERWEHWIRNEDTVDPTVPSAEEDIRYTHMWVEDSLGTRHPIPKSYEFVPKLQATLFDLPRREVES